MEITNKYIDYIKIKTDVYLLHTTYEISYFAEKINIHTSPLHLLFLTYQKTSCLSIIIFDHNKHFPHVF